MCAYVPPQSSPYYNVYDVKSGIELLEACLSDILVSLDDVYVDLNGRTSAIFPNTVSSTDYEDVLCRHEENESISRCSEDVSLNSYGKQLLSMCVTLGLYIMNGVCMPIFRVATHTFQTQEIA